MSHAATIEISKDILLSILDFSGGEIHDIYVPKEVWHPDIIRIVIEHPDLPEVSPAEELPIVVPTYQQVYKRQLVVVERTNPPKM